MFVRRDIRRMYVRIMAVIQKPMFSIVLLCGHPKSTLKIRWLDEEATPEVSSPAPSRRGDWG
jgi:hypothetical protein